MRDPTHYANPTNFDGYRFIDQIIIQDTSKPVTSVSKSTDTEAKSLLWSHGRRACPGRFYASHALKLMLRHIILHFGIRLADRTASRSFAWRASIIPHERFELLVKRRPGQG